MSSENYRIRNQHSVYFLTFTVTDWVDVFTRRNYREIIAESLSYCRKNKGLKLFAWCLMTNHIHMVCTTEPPFEMSYFVRDFKKFTAKAVLNDIKNLPKTEEIGCCIDLSLQGSMIIESKNIGFGKIKVIQLS